VHLWIIEDERENYSESSEIDARHHEQIKKWWPTELTLSSLGTLKGLGDDVLKYLTNKLDDLLEKGLHKEVRTGMTAAANYFIENWTAKNIEAEVT
jgi:hypothetical protein